MSAIKYRYNGRDVSEQDLDGLIPRKSDWLEKPAMTANTYTQHDPLVSEGCGVMKSQVQETRDLIKSHGIQGAAVRNNGQIEFTSRRARSEFLRMRGLRDIDGGFNDG
jgi:hypothetical protein